MWTAFVTSEKKKSLTFFFFLPFLPPSPPSPPSLPPQHQVQPERSVPAATFSSQPLWRSNEEQAAVAPLTPGLVWDAVTAVCFPLGSYLYISRENKQYVADLADPSIGCKQVGEPLSLRTVRTISDGAAGGTLRVCTCFYFNVASNISIFLFSKSISFSLDCCFFSLRGNFFYVFNWTLRPKLCKIFHIYINTLGAVWSLLIELFNQCIVFFFFSLRDSLHCIGFLGINRRWVPSPLHTQWLCFYRCAITDVIVHISLDSYLNRAFILVAVLIAMLLFWKDKGQLGHLLFWEKKMYHNFFF